MTGPGREAEIKAMLNAVDHALRAEDIPDRIRNRVLNRILCGNPDGPNVYYRTDPTTGAITRYDYATETPETDSYTADQFQRLHAGQRLNT